MGGQFLSPIGDFDSPYAVPHGGFGAIGNPGWAAQAWGNQMSGHFGQAQSGFPVLPMGQVVAASDEDTSHGASVGHSARGSTRGSRGGRTQSGRFKDKKEEKGPLATTNAGIVKSFSKSAKNKARRKAKMQAQDAFAGPADPQLLNVLAEPHVTDAGDIMLEDFQSQAEAEEDLALVDADSVINQAMRNPVGLELSRDQARVNV